MRDPKTLEETIAYFGWIDSNYRRCRAWLNLSFKSGDYEENERKYREAIGGVKAFRIILETVFHWPGEELDQLRDEIAENVKKQFFRGSQSAQTQTDGKLRRITPEKGKIYTLHSGGHYLCVEVLPDESPAGAVLHRVSDGYILNAHGLCAYQDGTIQWDYSTGGHWPDRGHTTLLPIQEAMSNLKKYQGYAPIDVETGCRRHAFDLNDETVDTILAALELLSVHLSNNNMQ